MDKSLLKPIDRQKAYRVLNIGPTVLVSTRHDGKEDIMTAAWAGVIDYDKMYVVVDKSHYSRGLIEKGEFFALQVPLKGIADIAMNLGSVSMNDDPEKLAKSGAKIFRIPESDLPLVEGCGAWIIIRRIREERNEQLYDLFIGEVVSAFSDKRVCTDGHWHFDEAGDDMRTLHYVAGGRFYTIGDAMDV